MAAVLVLGYGNPGRGDDALGPLLVGAMQKAGGDFSAIEFLCDFQLQIEHVLDLAGKELVLFADADASCAPPYRLEPLAARQDHSYSSHAMSPSALLHVYRKVLGAEPPPGFLLRIRGEGFELGHELSEGARAHLDAAFRFAKRLLDRPRADFWQSVCSAS